MEAVEMMLGVRRHLGRQKITNILAAVGQEGDGLVHLETLEAQNFQEPALGFGVETLYEAEIAILAIARQGLANEHTDNQPLLIG